MSTMRLGLALVLAVISGCRKAEAPEPVYPVRGRVLFNGKPATDALVVFHRKNNPNSFAPQPRAATDATGTFVLGTFKADDGAPAGEYVVTVALGGGAVSRGGSDRTPPPYEDPALSRINYEVKAGGNVVPDINLP